MRLGLGGIGKEPVQLSRVVYRGVDGPADYEVGI